MSVNVREVKARRDLKAFIYLPEKLHKDHRNWVPPVYMDEWKYFNPKKNKAFGYCQASLLLAYRDERLFGANGPAAGPWASSTRGSTNTGRNGWPASAIWRQSKTRKSSMRCSAGWKIGRGHWG